MSTQDPDDSLGPEPLDDSGLDQAIEGGFAAARDADPAAGQSVLQQVHRRTGALPSVSLRDVDAAGQTPMLKTSSETAGKQADTGKYKVLGLLGQGGVGTVHKGHDSDLGREVAMKFLHERYANEPSVLHRFVEEAQIGGQLQHPGIVPVYELGMADGRPFFTMKMVKGVTLAKKLAERTDVAEDRRTFLSIFEDICQTLAYAHARGVVHRDLKPANVMVGSFGEVQILDWGMGKVLQSGGLADEKFAADRQSQLSVIETLRSTGHGTQSVLGSVMGTPAYMPPEQARGDVDAMDERSDVFALGAILCEILTGQPPYVGDRNQLISMAAMGKLADAHARLAECRAEQELIELATLCLMPAKAARPKSAAAVATAAQQYLAAAEQRLHDATVRTLSLKRTQKLGMALTTVIAMGLATSLWFWQGARASAASERVAAGEAEQSARDATTAKREATAAQHKAETHLGNFNRLKYVVRMQTAKRAERELYPAWPENAKAMRDWLSGDATALRDALPRVRATLATLEAKALDQSEAAQAADLQTHPREFADTADQFLNDTLRHLVTEIEAFTVVEVAAVKQRLKWAKQVEELTITRHSQAWNEARLAILKADDKVASERYGDSPIELLPQLGLVPIGMNPTTKLWEFYHLRSAWDGSPDPAAIAIPAHRADGSIKVTDGTGIVFVLLPGGSFTMGRQKEDPTGPNFDPAAQPMDKPHIEKLKPFFLARHEMTQAQWARLWSGDESLRWPSQEPGNTLPVNNVNWHMSIELLTRHGLVLPMGAQWEYGCRAGTTTIFWPGNEIIDLAGTANVFDETGSRALPSYGLIPVPFDDGYEKWSPVGSFRANAFGLYDVHGNVWEWNLDSPADSHSHRINRGSDYSRNTSETRSGHSSCDIPMFLDDDQGLRPARALRLPD